MKFIYDLYITKFKLNYSNLFLKNAKDVCVKVIYTLPRYRTILVDFFFPFLNFT